MGNESRAETAAEIQRNAKGRQDRWPGSFEKTARERSGHENPRQHAIHPKTRVPDRESTRHQPSPCRRGCCVPCEDHERSNYWQGFGFDLSNSPLFRA
jgi:hypothetical protein